MSGVLVVGGVFREVLIGETGRELRLAGSGLYAAAAAASLGAETTLVAAIGSEDLRLADRITGELGVRASFGLAPGASGTFGLEVTQRGTLVRGYRPADSPPVLSGEVEVEPDVAIVFGHPEWDPCRSELVRSLTTSARLIWDRQGWMSRTRRITDGAWLPARERILSANAGEASELLTANGADSIPPDGFDSLVIKDGRWGVHLTGIESAAIPAYNGGSNSTLGSGDVFAGALGACLARGFSQMEATWIASAAAAEAISEAAPLPAHGFMGRVAVRLRSSATLPLLGHLDRAEARVAVRYPACAASTEIAHQLVGSLRAEGFTCAEARANGAAEIAIECGSRFLELDHFGPQIEENLFVWLAEILGAPARPPARAPSKLAELVDTPT